MNLLAHSFGPVLAARYAQTYPEHVGRIVFMGAIGPRRADAAAFGRTMYERMDSATRDSSTALVKSLITGSTPDPLAACRAYEKLLRHADSVQGQVTGSRGTSCAGSREAVEYAHRYTSQITLTSFGNWDYTKALKQVQAPLLVIYGDRDPSPLSSQQAWSAAVPRGRLLVIRGAGHRPHVDRPDVFFPAVDSFLSGRWPQGAVPIRPND
jgi:proline iminopeptidase